MERREYILGDLVARFVRHKETGSVELELIPADRLEEVEQKRASVSGLAVANLRDSKPRPARYKNDSLLQIKLSCDPEPGGFSGGVTQFDSISTRALEFQSQDVVDKDGSTEIRTTLMHPAGIRCVHRLRHADGEPGLTVCSEVINDLDQPVSVELLSSFVLGGLTPFHESDAPGRLKMHRFRSWWCAEGRRESRTLEELHLERPWVTNGARSERFGQVGMMPVRRFFPFAAIEDIEAGVCWGAKLAWAGSWQMEVLRRGDTVSLAGGLADREFGHWKKTLAPGETLVSPPAMLSCCSGDVDDLCRRFLTMEDARIPVVDSEESLPVVFNEWCSTWGSPTHQNVLATADRLQDVPVKYFVIDDGWAARPPEAVFQSNGDWVVDAEKFPDGLKATADALRERGLIPGLWFEFEVCNPGSKAWKKTDHHLHRDGRVLEVGTRRFWNLCDPWVQEYLSERLIGLLKESGIGYLKVDYNDTIGIGCDHPDSLGEGLRLQALAVQEFFRKLREEIPELVIENCASGGHRLEPSMMQLCSMGSFSDAHENEEIPIIAASLQRLILPRQSQVWAVLRKSDSRRRMVYSLAAAFLGRMCISGDVAALSEEQMNMLRFAIEFYGEAAPIIKSGTSGFFGELSESYIHPQGWQGVVRYHSDRRSALVVVHSFELKESAVAELPLADGPWRIVQKLTHQDVPVGLSEATLRVPLRESFAGQVYLLSV